MADPGAVVSAFIAEFDAEHPDVATLMSYFNDNPVYHNMPGDPAEGREAVEKGLAYTQQMNLRGWEVVHQAVNGNVVINERIDRFDVGGKDVVLPVLGVFEVDDDGKIAAWRDYFDMNMFTSQMPQQG